ncbi:hypothetical protein MYU51_009633 [Penicillium brevicompactum]|uniref:uncharacterized protein n=1 Tax=Penicillium brevicompactum TaxID=5074 RepID=UPI00253FB777|nr:uncharacterized protein N7506_000938 [Penicillium brevicompactum]KAJ5347685.1 hypothetical protein N7506_000938 [Penicillium brevicompactum]
MDPASTLPTIELQAPMTQATKKKRIRNWTAEDRALHREFEKSRREAFSESLMELTKIIPALQVEPRPSKHVILDASIAYHQAQHAKCVRISQAFESMVAERDDLLQEINVLRALCHPGTYAPRQARPIDSAVLGMLAEDKLSTADPTNEHESIQSPTEAPSQAIGTSLPGSQQTASLLAVPQGTLLDTTQPNPARLANAHNPITLPEWSWKEPRNILQQTAFSPSAINEAALSWNRPPTATPPRDVGHEFDVDHLYPIDVSAQFWTQHSSSLQVTPPGDNVAFANLDVSALLHPYPSVMSIFPPEEENLDTYGSPNLEISFNPNTEQLSIPMGNMVGDGTNNPPSTMCPTN